MADDSHEQQKGNRYRLSHPKAKDFVARERFHESYFRAGRLLALS